MANVLEVPLATDGEVLTVDLESDLPEDPAEICVLLENERCAPKYWLAFAAAYAQKGDSPGATEVVERGLHTPQGSADAPQMLMYLAWLRLHQYRAQRSSEIYEKVVDAVNQAYTASSGSPDALLVRGAMAQVAGNVDDSMASFTQLLKAQPENIYGLFGRARVLYHRKSYHAALRIYQNLLRMRVSAPDPRIGIALCFWQLGDFAKAALALERSLSLATDPDTRATANAILGNVLLCQAIHDPSVNFGDVYAAGLDHLVQAYKHNKNPLAAAGLASYFFSKHELEKVSKLCTQVVDSTQLPQLRGEAEFWLGRVNHYSGNDESALELYRSASPTNEAAQLGLALVQLRLGLDGEALHTLEALAKSHPRLVAVHFYFGLVKAKRAATSGNATEHAQAVALLERYLKLCTQERETPRPEARLLLARLTERSDAAGALDQLRQAIVAQPDAPAALRVNQAVLAFQVQNFEEAQAALAAAQRAADAATFAPTIAYNSARILEALGRREEAAEAYDKLPRYVDARSRLLLLRFLDPETPDAAAVIKQLETLVEQNSKNGEARALLGWLLHQQYNHHKRTELRQKEQQLWKDTLVGVDKHDGYALVALGNVYLANAREVRIQRDSDADKRDRAYMRAAEFFDKALQIDSHNAYAAQGLAIVYAETARASQALQILGRIRETLIDDPTVCVNTGHCLMDLKQYQRAAELYELALTKLPQADPGVYSLLGRAWYARGQASKDPAALETALEHAIRAAELSPEQLALKFNVAYVQFQLADTVRRLPEEKLSLALLERARKHLSQAIVSLRELATADHPPYPAADLEGRAELAESTVAEQLSRLAADRESQERENSAKLESARLQLQAERDAAEAERAKREQEQEERERAVAEERARLAAEAQVWEEERAAEREAEPERKKTRKGSTKADQDDFIDDADQPPSPKSPDLNDESDADEGAEKPEAEPEADAEPETESAPVNRNNVIDDDDDDEDEEEKVDADKKDVDDLF